MGIPLYGRSFMNTEGPGTPFQGLGPGSWETGVYDYKALPQPGSIVTIDNGITASWSYDASQRFMVSYDTPAIVAKKAEFVKSLGLGGGMWWERSAGQDVPDPGPDGAAGPDGPAGQCDGAHVLLHHGCEQDWWESDGVS